MSERCETDRCSDEGKPFVQLSSAVNLSLRRSAPPGVSKAAAWESEMLLRCAKNSFRSMKKQWKRGQDEAVAKRAQANESTTRMYRRRCTVSPPYQFLDVHAFVSIQKYAHVKSQIEAYAERYSIPVSVVEELLHEQLLSDEASGPEDDDEESPAAWKVRMGMHHGLQDVSSSTLKKYAFLEVLETPWRSAEVFIRHASIRLL